MNKATNHYAHYPKENNTPIYLAYGFRILFLVLPFYILFISIFWILLLSGVINITSVDIISWHIYEFLFGLGVIGILAFLLTGLPEMYPGVTPIIGKNLIRIVALWFASRVSFYFVDYLNIYIIAVLNILPLLWVIFWAFKPVVLDKLQRHSSIAYTLVAILITQILFFLSISKDINLDTIEILKVSFSFFMVLILLALRRVNTEAINEYMHENSIDDTFVARPHRYNLAIFNILLYCIVSSFYENSAVLGWICLSTAASLLAILNDYRLKYESIIFTPYVISLSLIIVCMSLGYGFIGINILNQDFHMIKNSFHFLSTGAFGLAFFMILLVVTYVHTARELKTSITFYLGQLFIVIATILRFALSYYPEFTTQFYTISTILFSLAFLLYFIQYKNFLLQKRVDGLKG